ncbi:MAG TPA: hypothetical protein VG944_20605, partial [Fimbriimonas sp.]|nr:hypothetical protein [Fimbriimonas sp.]
MLASLLAFLVSASPQMSSPVVVRQSFYTTEQQGEVLVQLPDDAPTKVLIQLRGQSVQSTVKGRGIGRVPFPLEGLPMGTSKLTCLVAPTAHEPWTADCDVIRLPPKPNEVKIDRLTGAFITDGLPLFPCGFYCYSPVQPTLPEEEFVRGFSMISPYQDIQHSDLADRKRYMDRCGQLGMKVNYSLVSLSGGGSGSNLSETDKAKRELLVKEVNEFKDHPALLAWYLCDEPDGENVSPLSLEEQYKIVHDLDPYHPITEVFNTPSKAPLYRKSIDVAMADPYPIPNSPATDAGDTIANLRKSFGWEVPLWIVPQAFGGNEWWAREPTPQEMRMMTWQSILNGATGIQCFIRHGLGAFPKSPTMWAECGKIAEEVFELEPFLHSAEKAPDVACNVSTVQARCWRSGSELLVALVNKTNVPVPVHVKVDTKATEARLPFENRSVLLSRGAIDEFVDAYGTRFYILEEGSGWKKDPANSVVDPSFEENPTAGVPSGCYLNLRSDRGATVRIDPRVAHSGRRSA